MPRKVDTNQLVNWKKAQKTKGLKAKPLSSLLVDRSVLAKFLVSTLEGNETLDIGNVICIGQSDDAWQQTPKALFKKYNIVGLDEDGWMLCEPKPENEVEFVEIDESFFTETTTILEVRQFYIIGLWGKDTPEGPVQYGKCGDIVCRQPYDHNDVWIVRRRLFDNTYSIK